MTCVPIHHGVNFTVLSVPTNQTIQTRFSFVGDNTALKSSVNELGTISLNAVNPWCLSQPPSPVSSRAPSPAQFETKFETKFETTTQSITDQFGLITLQGPENSEESSLDVSPGELPVTAHLQELTGRFERDDALFDPELGYVDYVENEFKVGEWYDVWKLQMYDGSAFYLVLLVEGCSNPFTQYWYEETKNTLVGL
jgi:hypothetical protein